MEQAPLLSIVIPTLDEAAQIADCVHALEAWRRAGHEVILADGGSSDDTVARASSHVDVVLTAPRGRALQMNAGAAAARGRLLLFLHADTALPIAAEPALRVIAGSSGVWGRFDVTLSGHEPWCRILEWFINWRSRLAGIATGDQGIFVHRDLFESAGRFPEQPLMEDIALSRRLRRHARPVCLRLRVVTSSRRWREYGVMRTVLTMWGLRFAYWLGIPPRVLVRIYERH